MVLGFCADDSCCSQRVDTAKARIESLNPLVAVETLSDPSVLENDALDILLSGVDMVCVTDFDRETLVRALFGCFPVSRAY